MTFMLNGITRTDDGFILATQTGTAADDTWNGGLRFRAADGALRININAPQRIVNGWPCVSSGAVSVNFGGAETEVQNGIPFTATGTVAGAVSGTIDHLQNGLPFIGNSLAFADVP